MVSTMKTTKLNAVVAAVREQEPRIPDTAIEEYIEADWPEGEEHADWLGSASVAEIATWVTEGLRNWDFEQDN